MSEESSSANLPKRAAVKSARRREDAAQIAQGVDPEKIQEQNSAFPKGYFSLGRISNLAVAVGK